MSFPNYNFRIAITQRTKNRDQNKDTERTFLTKMDVTGKLSRDKN